MDKRTRFFNNGKKLGSAIDFREVLSHFVGNSKITLYPLTYFAIKFARLLLSDIIFFPNFDVEFSSERI